MNTAASGSSQGGAPTAHEGPVEIGLTSNSCSTADMGTLSARFVCYPDCQQLTVWLPQPGHTGYGDLTVVRGNGGLLERVAVRDRLNGSVQILFDTLAWPPGEYRLEIEHEDGWYHELLLHKLEFVPPALSAAPALSTYRNGRGGISLESEFLARSAQCRLEYEGTFCAGTITYVEGNLRIVFWHEIGSGDCRFHIDVPTAERWEAATATALARRDEIVDFVAEMVRREKAESWGYIIEPAQIGYY